MGFRNTEGRGGVNRGLFTFQQAWKHRAQLKQVKKNDFSIKQLIEIKADWLKSKNIKVLVLDFDGVMAAHGEALPCEEVVSWLQNLSKEYMQKNIYILSNKPTEERRAYFKENFPEVTFVGGVRKKPYPDGMLEVVRLSGIEADKIALVDDRLLTGCLACLLAGAKPIWLTKPYANFKSSPFFESLFGIFRLMDRVFVL